MSEAVLLFRGYNLTCCLWEPTNTQAYVVYWREEEEGVYHPHSSQAFKRLCLDDIVFRQVHHIVTDARMT